MQKTNSLVIGAGEVGTSLYNVLKETYGDDVYLRDKKEPDGLPKHFFIINITFPYVENFVDIVESYIDKYQPTLTIVHSTVPPGTCDTIKGRVAHTPIRGKHPHLEKSIKTFVKFVAGKDPEQVQAAQIYLEKAGIKTLVYPSMVATEVAKICSTSYLGYQVWIMHEHKRIADKFKVPFEYIYTIPNETYNEGYAEMGMPQYKRPVLEYIPGKIGGHCVIQNTYLMNDLFTRRLRELNEYL